MIKRNILLLGSYGRGNIGDDAFLVALMRLFDKYHVTINSSDDSLLPNEVKNRVKTIPTNMNLIMTVKAIIAADFIVYGGGDLWVELKGDKMPRQSLWKMVIMNLLARLCGKKVFYIGCGAGDLSNFSLFLARLSAKLANGTIIRDKDTLKLLNLKGIYLPDLTINLIDDEIKRMRKSSKTLVAMSLLYYIPNPSENYSKLLDAFEKLCKSLDSDRFEIILIPMLLADADSHNDKIVAKELKNRLSQNNISIFKGNDIKDLQVLLNDIDLMVGVRLHANILSTWSGKPSLGVAYRPKVARFFELNNLSDNYIEMKDLYGLSEKFWKMFNQLEIQNIRIAEVKMSNSSRKAEYEKFVFKNF